MNTVEQKSTVVEKIEESRIYTMLKFVKSDMTGATVSFVSRNPKTGRICGVRQDSEYPKKICVANKTLAKQIILNSLYKCELIPMANHNGYVVVSAEPVQFKAKIVTSCIKGNIYRVEVRFGNKTIRFDPFNGKKDSVKHLKECKAVLEKRIDIKDIVQVVADFEESANTIMMLMNKDLYRKKI